MRKFGRHRLTQDQSTLCAAHGDTRRIIVRPILGMNWAPVPCWHVFGIDDVLNTNRYSPHQSARGMCIDRTGVGESRLRIEVHPGIDLSLAHLNALKASRRHLFAICVARFDHARDFVADSFQSSVIRLSSALPRRASPSTFRLDSQMWGTRRGASGVEMDMTEMIQPTGSGVGAFVNGIDLADSLSDNMVGELRNALGEHGVLFFRDQNISPEAHMTFAEKFAPINVNRFIAHVDGYPKITQVLKEPDQRRISAAAGTRTTPTTRSRRWARSC